METWIAPVITALISGIILLFVARILTKLDQISTEITGVKKDLAEIKTEQAVQKVQLQMVLDYFMPEKKNRIGE